MTTMIPKALAYLFFVACMVIGAVIVIGISFLPIDAHSVCDPIVNMTRYQVNYYCVCQPDTIQWFDLQVKKK